MSWAIALPFTLSLEVMLLATYPYYWKAYVAEHWHTGLGQVEKFLLEVGDMDSTEHLQKVMYMTGIYLYRQRERQPIHSRLASPMQSMIWH